MIVRNGNHAKTVFTVSVPCNCTAEIVLSDGTEKTVTAGKYEVETKQFESCGMI